MGQIFSRRSHSPGEDIVGTKRAITSTGSGDKELLDVSVNVGSGAASCTLVEFVVDASPDYAINDQVGEAVEITNAARFTGGGGILEHISAYNKANVVIDIAFHFFRAEPTSTSGDDNAAMAISDADSELHLFSVSIPKGRFYVIGNVHASLEAYLRYQCDGTSLWVVAQALSAINFAASDDLGIVLGLRKD
jgi:hypothetical protein